MKHHTAELVRASLRGAVDVEVSPTGLIPLRLPLSAKAQFDGDWMRIASAQASGVRCEFRTAATWLELTVETAGLYLPWVPDGQRWAVFSGTVDGGPLTDVRTTGGSELHLGEPDGTAEFVRGCDARAGGERPRSISEERASDVRRVVVWSSRAETESGRGNEMCGPKRTGRAGGALGPAAVVAICRAMRSMLPLHGEAT